MIPELITREFIANAKVGDYLWDMHNQMPMEAGLGEDMERASIPVNIGMRLCEEARNLRNLSYANKFLVVIGTQIGVPNTNDSMVTCCFVYDGRFSRIITFIL